MALTDLRDPSGNPLPIALPSIPDLAPLMTIPSIDTLKAMLLPYMPTIEPITPCPAYLDIAKAKAKAAAGG